MYKRQMYNSGSGTVEEATVSIVSLFSVKGLQYMLTSAVTNFTSYAPLGFTIVIMLGIGVAESSGYLNGLIRKVVKVTPAALVTPMVVFIGVMTNVAENAGYVVFIPLAAMIFKAYKKHPLAGIAAGFAGVSGGFSANLLIGSADATLSLIHISLQASASEWKTSWIRQPYSSLKPRISSSLPQLR